MQTKLSFNNTSKSISIAEFLESNRQMLGFSSPARNMLLTVKEGVDNSLDAAEDAGILSDIEVRIIHLDKKLYRIELTDNGPGIPKEKIGSVFGKLLYGSKFHEKKQKRGQQGLGISAVVLNSQIDTNIPATVIVKRAHEPFAHFQNVAINIVKNEANITNYKKLNVTYHSGVHVSITLRGIYITEGKRSIKHYLEQVSLMNTWANITLIEPSGNTIVYPRTSEAIQNPTIARLYPSTVPLGTFSRILTAYDDSLIAFLEYELESNKYIISDFFEYIQLPPDTPCTSLLPLEVVTIHNRLKTYAYPLSENSIALVGETELLKAVKAELYDFSVSITSPTIAFENTIARFETVLVYGGPLPKEQKMEVSRFVNKVPLLLQPGSCLLYNAISKINWKNYGLDQNRDEMPSGPVKLIVHLAGYKIPFNSEAKESVSEIPKLQALYLQMLRRLGLRLNKKLSKQLQIAMQKEKLKLMQVHVPALVKSLNDNGETLNNEIVLLSLTMAGTLWRKTETGIKFANFTSNECVAELKCSTNSTYISIPAKSTKLAELNEPILSVVSEMPIYEIDDSISWTLSDHKPGYKSIISTLPFNDLSVRKKLDYIIRDLGGQIYARVIPSIAIRTRTKQNLVLHEEGYWALGNEYSIKSSKKVNGIVQLIRLIKLIELFKIQLDANKTASLREIYYNTERWGKYYKFEDQQSSDRYIEALEVLIGLSREFLGVFPEARGQIAGPITISELTKRGPKLTDCQLDLPQKGGGIAIPFSIEHLELKEVRGKFVLAIETSGAFCRLVENEFDKEYNAILICLNGQPTRSTKELLKMLAAEGLPIYTFLDSDSWSFRIHGSCAYGSIKTAHLSHRFAVPSIIHLGLGYDDIVKYNLPTDRLKEVDVDGFKQLLEDPRYSPEVWHDVFTRQLEARVKAEQQSLAALGINFVTEVYLPTKLRELGVIQ